MDLSLSSNVATVPAQLKVPPQKDLEKVDSPNHILVGLGHERDLLGSQIEFEVRIVSGSLPTAYVPASPRGGARCYLRLDT